MSGKLEILSQVMLSLTTKQKKIMHNINVLLSNRDELDLIDKVEIELTKLAGVHAQMQECESFMLQVAQAQLKSEENSESGDQRIAGGIDEDSGKHSEK